MKRNGVIVLTLIVIIIIAIGMVAFFFYGGNSNTPTGIPFVPTWNDSTLGDIEINEGVIGYVLFQLEAYELHNPIFSSNTPKIEVVVDGEVFTGEIDKGNIIVNSGSTDEEDIRISMTRINVINIINSTMPADTIQSSINEGTMSFEQVASKTTLFTKGYLSLYIRFTEEKVDIIEQELEN